MPEELFKGISFIEKIVFPNKTKKMNCSFDNSVLKEFVLPSCLKDFKGYIKCGASSLKFPSSLKITGDYVFSENKSLKIVNLSNTQVEEICSKCYEDCRYSNEDMLC